MKKQTTFIKQKLFTVIYFYGIFTGDKIYCPLTIYIVIYSLQLACPCEAKFIGIVLKKKVSSLCSNPTYNMATSRVKQILIDCNIEQSGLQKSMVYLNVNFQVKIRIKFKRCYLWTVTLLSKGQSPECEVILTFYLSST